MTRSYQATHDLTAVSANLCETAINVEQDLDTTMLCALGDVINLEHRRESNANEATGKEEPDSLYDLGSLANGSFNFEKAQPQHIAFLATYALGSCTTGAAGGGHEHVITPITGDLDTNRSVPSFTAAQRFGNNVLRRMYASMFVDSLTATFARDSWVKISGALKGTGKYTNNVVEETISALGNATHLDLATLKVAGSSAAERLQNVQRIRVNLSGSVWTEVVYTAVDDSTPSIIAITSPGGAASAFNYKVLYIPTEAAWATFPARVNETPLRVSQMTLNVGGVWSGSAFAGGRALTAEMKQIEWSFQNGLQVQFVPGAGGTYASRAIRDGRTQKLKLDREFREFIMQQHLLDNDTMGVYILVEGAEYEAGHHYQAEFIWPKVGVLAAPISVDGKRLGESGDLQVLEDDTYGSVIVKVKNLQPTYAA